MYNTDLPTRAELPSTGKLLKSTGIAALIAVALLVTTVLPAEYGIDPTGIGRMLGLTRMGEIKVALAAEAAKAEVTPAAPAPSQASTSVPAVAPIAALPASPVAPAPSVASQAAATRQDTMSVTLKPGEAAEIKVAMRKDASVEYEWSTVGGPVNFDTHGDPVNAPKGFYHGYSKGRNETRNAGTLQAAFDGTHGWFWRNRSAANVTVTLKTSGDYQSIKRVM